MPRASKHAPSLLTIGAIGFDKGSFFKAITASGADLFCDIRARRAVRGRDYAFANSNRLQASLAKLNIPYLHLKDLAPTQAMRDLQHAADDAAGIPRRQRTELSRAYITAYRAGRLKNLNSQRFAKEVLAPSTRPVFFCVEREPKACHRSLLAAKLAKDLRLPVQHLTP